MEWCSKTNAFCRVFLGIKMRKPSLRHGWWWLLDRASHVHMSLHWEKTVCSASVLARRHFSRQPVSVPDLATLFMNRLFREAGNNSLNIQYVFALGSAHLPRTYHPSKRQSRLPSSPPKHSANQRDARELAQVDEACLHPGKLKAIWMISPRYRHL